MTACLEIIKKDLLYQALPKISTERKREMALTKKEKNDREKGVK